MRRHIPFERLHNFRDLGGYRTADGGRVRWNLLYRSDSLAKLADASDTDRKRFHELGVETVIDLRYPWEIAAKGRLPETDGIVWHNLSIEHRPYDQAEIDPSLDPWRYLADRFAEVATDGAAELREALEVIAAADGPLVFHCASGKDRTGLLAGLLLGLLDVSEQQILDDFALTELATERLIADWRATHPGRELRWPGYGRAPAQIMRLFLADLRRTYGSVHAYTTGHVGLDPSVIEALRARLVESGP
ncbi:MULTISPECIES: tyrosine-protein phosphatase [Streptomyces]|uniref:tyrosine-protein phosphatase n=1 Tax=Streptomyces TaxID=1883 RepID=UPI00131890FA|nr:MULTISPECIES: tyrosine-protein phosphatase [Streptomyces]QGZ51070.1 protein-tyrosine-phosphatase [Streptomyces sp. QHH-9511]GGT99924.1 protein-tyrosine-phosphatase [Streptomyces lateritius]